MRLFHIGIFASGVLCLICVLVGMLFYNRYRSRLTDAAVYHVMAGQYTEKEDWQSALMYENEAAKRDPSLSSACLAASLLLQERQWACVTRMEEGKFIGQTGAVWSFDEVRQIEETAEEHISLRDSSQDYYLFDCVDYDGNYVVYDRNRKRMTLLEDVGLAMIDSYGQAYMAFYQKGTVTLYDPVKDASCIFQLDVPTEYAGLVHVAPAGEQACLVMNEEEGTIALYRISFVTGEGQMAAKTQLSDLFGECFEREIAQYGEVLGGFYQFAVSPARNVAVVGRTVGEIDDSWSDAVVLQLSDLECRKTLSDEHYALNGISFCDDGECFALVYGNDSGMMYAGGYVSVHDAAGKELFSTGIHEKCAFYGAKFREAGSGELILWGRRKLQFWNYRTGKEYAVSLTLPAHISAVTCGEGSHCIVESDNLYYYDLVSFSAEYHEEDAEETGNGLKLLSSKDTGFSLLAGKQYIADFETEIGTDEDAALAVCVTLRDPEGNVCDRLELAAEGSPENFYWTYSFSEDFKTLYLCLRDIDLYRIDIAADEIRIAGCEKLVPSYWQNGLCPVEKGIVVLGMNAQLYYYGQDTTVYQELGNQQAAGKVESLATNGTDLFAMVISSQSSTVFEFWDLETQSCIADFKPEQDQNLVRFGFVDENVFLYGTQTEDTCLRIISDMPDRQAQKALRAICGMTVEDGRAEYVQEIFDGNLGNWGALRVNYR